MTHILTFIDRFIRSVLVRAFLVHSNRLSHRSLFLKAFLVEHLCSQTERLLGELRELVGSTRFTLSVALHLVHSNAEAFSVAFHMFMLWLKSNGQISMGDSAIGQIVTYHFYGVVVVFVVKKTISSRN